MISRNGWLTCFMAVTGSVNVNLLWNLRAERNHQSLSNPGPLILGRGIFKHLFTAYPILKSSRDVESPTFFKIASSNTYYHFGCCITLSSPLEEKGKEICGLL